ncbi:class I SAM-dependent methyltransferase [Nocardia callitridis]|uniref:S-adenosyl-L-methionine-dependent methyltransferase n=2 Tax=Nocardia callitridis TaxID=648753 RepID=A0ABP9K8L6_9NOCA
MFVAAARALGSRRPDPLAVDPLADVFLRAAGPEWSALIDADPDRTREHPLRSADFGEGFITFQCARTRYFDDYFAEAARAGVRQVVILAAGLDSRAYRLPWPDDTVVYELDRPQVLEFKNAVLSEHGGVPVAERRAVAADLREDWSTALRDKGFDPTAASAWLLEGLLLYLPASAQDQLFATIDTLAAPGSRIAIEQLAALPEETYDAIKSSPSDGDEDSSAAEWAHMIYNEPHSEAAQWFAERGWQSTRTELPEYLRACGRAVPSSATDGGFTLDQISLVTAVRPT